MSKHWRFAGSGLVAVIALMVLCASMPLRAGTIIDIIKNGLKPKEDTSVILDQQTTEERLAEMKRIQKELRIHKQIFDLYRKHLGRKPDPGGWDHYYKLITEEGWDIARVEKAILNSAEYKKKHPAAEKKVTGSGSVNATIGLNVRTGPGAENTILTALPYGSTVTIVGEKDGWYKIKYGGGTAWVCGRYITRHTGQQNAGKTPPASSRAKAAVDWAYRQMNPATGTGVNRNNGKSTSRDPAAWKGWCLAFVATAYGRAVPDLNQYCAYDAYKQFKAHGNIRTGTPIPAGAPIFFGPTSGNPYGHIAIASGKTTATGDPIIINPGTTVKEIPLSTLKRYCGTYLGWGTVP